MLLLITWSWVLLTVLILTRAWFPGATGAREIDDVKVRVRCKDSNKEKHRRCWGQPLPRAAGTARMSSALSSH